MTQNCSSHARRKTRVRVNLQKKDKSESETSIEKSKKQERLCSPAQFRKQKKRNKQNKAKSGEILQPGSIVRERRRGPLKGDTSVGFPI